ncbi:MAG: hypothetical protein WC374_01075 [Phycisphaerae bacterium]
MSDIEVKDKDNIEIDIVETKTINLARASIESQIAALELELVKLKNYLALLDQV